MDTDADRARWRTTLTHHVDDRLSLGIEYNPAVEEIGPLLNYTIAHETATCPMLNFGISSDRIGTPEGPLVYYLTAAKTFGSVVPYVSLAWSEHDDGFNLPFGANIFLDERIVLIPMYDGQRSHLLLTWRGERTSVSLMWVWLERPGISVSWGF